jgi:hypothetical protein
MTKLRSGNSLNYPATSFPNLSYWSSRCRFFDRVCQFEIADSTAIILSGSRFFLERGILSGETCVRFLPIIVPSGVSAVSFVNLAPSRGWTGAVISSPESS